MKIRWLGLLFALGVTAVLSACGGGAAAPTATPQAVPPAPTSEGMPPAPTPETAMPPIGGDPDVVLGGTIVQLVGALDARDIATLQLLALDKIVVELAMGDRPSSEVALNDLLADHLSAPSDIALIDVGQFNYADEMWIGPTYEDLLGFDVRECCGTVLVAAAVRVSGWGQNGASEAILVIIDGAPVDRNFVWHAFAALEPGQGGDPFAAMTLGEYEEAVRQAVVARDAELMAQVMRQDHSIGYWQSQSVTLSPIEASTELLNHNDAMYPITFAEVPPSVYEAGIDPETFFGPNVTVGDVLWSTGWGPDGAGEALFVIQSLPDGSYAWTHTLVAPAGIP